VAKKTINQWQFGDFQTPRELAKKIIHVLKQNHNIFPDVVIEPSCGKGSFISASFEAFNDARILGFDINAEYIAEARASLKCAVSSGRVSLQQADFFVADWATILAAVQGYVLIVGNPPWVTSSELGKLNSTNLPEKSNFQNRKGIDAITGAGNFDISEWMLLQHVNWLAQRDGAIALLCKYAVARKVMRQVRQTSDHRLFGHVYPIDARRYFNASVDACLFVLTTDTGNADCEVYDSLDSTRPSRVIGERDGFIVSNVEGYEKWKHLRGQDARYVWRSGVKHDCSKVMELEPHGPGYKNGFSEVYTLEDDYIFPLFKSSDIGNGRTASYRKLVIITQKTVGEDTARIKEAAPCTWRYLMDHRVHLNNRKSSIYRNKPEFSVFGIGPYSFKPWKVAISGLYKKLSFCIVGPLGGKTVAFDDTINFLSFDTEDEASFICGLLTSSPALEFLDSMIFWDEKRPVTAEILRRLSLREVARQRGSLADYYRWADAQAAPTSGQMELGIAEKEGAYVTGVPTFNQINSIAYLPADPADRSRDQ